MKFAIINDIHYGPTGSGWEKGVQRKLVSEAEKLVKKFVVQMNTKDHPEFVINLGDSIEDVNDKNIDIQSFKTTLSWLSGLKMPVYTLIGNHDVRTLTTKEISAMLGYQMNYSFNHGLFHFIALSFAMIGNHTQILSDITAEIPEDQINWLKVNLSKTDKPVIVFNHYGLAEDDMKGNFWFESEPQYALLKNRQQVRSIFEESGRVKAVISAHQHWNRMKIHHGIPYFTVTALTENFNNDGVSSKAYTIVNLDQNKIIVEVKGNDPARFDFSFT